MPYLHEILSFALLSALPVAPLMAAVPNFAQFPAESAFRMPAPNVIVSVDNALSMDIRDVPGADGARITRLQALKQLLRELLAPDVLPDDAIRLAFQATHGCNQLPAEGRPTPSACFNNRQSHRMASFRGTADPAEASTRGAFWHWLDTLGVGDGIAANRLMENAGTYLMQTDAENPWNDIPATPQAAGIQRRSCRRAYHLFLTDGAFATRATPPPMSGTPALSPLPDGTVFDLTSNPQLAIYRDSGNALSPSSLALRYWATDLQPALENRVPAVYPQPLDEVHSAPPRSITLKPYWNPRNSPATWQHMVNFTVDFGGASAAPDTYADYDQLLVGTLAWPDPFASIDAMRQDLRHAALNSRGQHFQIGPSVDQLKQAMSGVIARIVPSDGQVISGYASNGGNATYVAAYEASGWSGQIHASLLEPGLEKGVPNPEWGLPPRHGTGASLDSLASVDQRVILTHNGATDQGGGIPLRWQSLNLAQQAQLQSHGSSASYAQNLVQFLRGDRSLESNDPSTGFRMRRSRQGDIVHSRIWHVGKPMSGHADKGYRDFSIQHASRPPVLYVGGNDGMLHGFSARTGDELVAYVPLGAHPHLHLLAAQDYRHRYYVDGSPFTGDALIGTQWKTFLVGAMGAGGPGYFVLDATSPERFSESAASELVVMDRTDGSDPDVGHIFAAPTLDEANARRALQITRLNNGRWAVVLGNGYGSANGRPVLLIQYLDGARELVKIAATAPSPATAGKASMVANGLSAPQFLDVNSDGIPDAVYAGDLQGRLWKFDIAAASDQRWAVALGGAPLFTAVRNGKSQPITVAPVLRVHPEVGGLMVAFGTGQELTEADSGDTAVQTVYAVMDYTRYRIQESGEDKGKALVDTTRRELPSPAASRADLMPQGVQDQPVSGDPRAGRIFWQLLNAPFNYCTRSPCGLDEKKGWYLDLPARERVLDPIGFYGGGNLLEITSRVPATAVGLIAGDGQPIEACEQDPRPGQTYRTVVNILTGAAQKSRILDTNGDGQVTTDDVPASRSTAARQELRVPASDGAQLRQGSDGTTDRLQALPTRVLRPSWRHLK